MNFSSKRSVSETSPPKSSKPSKKSRAHKFNATPSKCCCFSQHTSSNLRLLTIPVIRFFIWKFLLFLPNFLNKILFASAFCLTQMARFTAPIVSTMFYCVNVVVVVVLYKSCQCFWSLFLLSSMKTVQSKCPAFLHALSCFLLSILHASLEN